VVVVLVPLAAIVLVLVVLALSFALVLVLVVLALPFVLLLLLLVLVLSSGVSSRRMVGLRTHRDRGAEGAKEDGDRLVTRYVTLVREHVDDEEDADEVEGMIPRS